MTMKCLTYSIVGVRMKVKKKCYITRCKTSITQNFGIGECIELAGDILMTIGEMDCSGGSLVNIDHTTT